MPSPVSYVYCRNAALELTHRGQAHVTEAVGRQVLLCFRMNRLSLTHPPPKVAALQNRTEDGLGSHTHRLPRLARCGRDDRAGRSLGYRSACNDRQLRAGRRSFTRVAVEDPRELLHTCTRAIMRDNGERLTSYDPYRRKVESSSRCFHDRLSTDGPGFEQGCVCIAVFKKTVLAGPRNQRVW